jgi:hypothetical protein
MPAKTKFLDSDLVKPERFDIRIPNGDKHLLYAEPDFTSAILRVSTDPDAGYNFLQVLSDPIEEANPSINKVVIRQYIQNAINGIQGLTTFNIEKDEQAREFLKATTNLRANIEVFKQASATITHGKLKNNKTVMPLSPEMLDKQHKIQQGIKKVEQLYKEYLTIMDFETGEPSTSPHHKEILNQRFINGKEYAPLNLLKSLESYNTVNPDTATTKLLTTLDYFQLQDKKMQIIKVLTESKSKFLQRSANVKLLSEIIKGVEAAKSYEDIEREVNKARANYKPRTLFSVNSSSSFQTIKKLDKLIEKERTYSVEKGRLKSNPGVAVEIDYLTPIKNLLDKDSRHLQDKLGDAKRRGLSKKTILRYQVQLRTIKAALMTIETGKNQIPKSDVADDLYTWQANHLQSSHMKMMLDTFEPNPKATSFQRMNALTSYFSRPEVQKTLSHGDIFYSDLSAVKINNLLKRYNKFKAKEDALLPKNLKADDEFKQLLANRNRSRHHDIELVDITQGVPGVGETLYKENISQGVPGLGVTPYNVSDSIQYGKGLLFGDKMSRNQTVKEAPIGKAEADHHVGVRSGTLAHETLEHNESKEEYKSSESNPGLNILFAGDLMVSATGTSPQLGLSFMLELRAADAIVINLEAPVSFKEGKTARGLVGLGFEMSKTYLADFVKDIKIANKDIKIVYNVANNHALDGNDKVRPPSSEKERKLFDNDPKNYILARTVAAINEIDPDGIVIGAHAMKKGKSTVKNDPIGVLDMKGLRVGLLGFTDVMNHNAKYWDRRVYRSEDIPTDLNKVKRDMKLDYICPFGHGSLEQSIYTTKHWRDLLVNLVKRGADFIIGHGPHVPQSNEVLSGKLIVHSLGNLFGPKKLHSTGLNLMAKINLSKDKMKFDMIPVEATVDKKGVPLIKCADFKTKSAYPSLMARLKKLLPTEQYVAAAPALAQEHESPRNSHK